MVLWAASLVKNPIPLSPAPEPCMTQEQYRQKVAEALARNDPHGVCRDADSAAEGMDPMSLDDAAGVIARMFSDDLRAFLGSDKMLQVIARNRHEPDKLICHSHDFCDPNQIMIDLFDRLGLDCLPEDDSERRLALALCDKAWSIAKAREFAV
jgi:hypothetical protein